MNKFIFYLAVIVIGTTLLCITDTNAYEYQGKKIIEKIIPVTLVAKSQKQTYKPNEPILVILNLQNEFKKGELFFERFTLIPNDWNGEIFNVDIPDIYRNSIRIYEQHPEMHVPITVSGVGLEKVSPHQSMNLTIDISKWKVRDGWIPGKYKMIFRLDRIIIDKYVRISVTSEAIKIEIKE